MQHLHQIAVTKAGKEEIEGTERIVFLLYMLKLSRNALIYSSHSGEALETNITMRPSIAAS